MPGQAARTQARRAAIAAVVGEFLEAAGRAGRERTLAPLRRRMITLFRRMFREQGAALAKALRKVKLNEAKKPSPPQPWDSDYEAAWGKIASATEALISDASVALITKAMRVSAEELLRNVGHELAFDLANPRAVRYLTNRGAELVKGIDEVSRDRIRELLVQQAEAGASYTDIAKALRGQFEDWAQSRAKTIAVNELGNAYEQGAKIAARSVVDAGFGMQKSWLTAGDDRVEEECLGNAEAGWIGIDEEFPSGHAEPLAHVNCRCTALYRRDKGKEEEKPTVQ